jgi:hypothetical protein
VAFLTIGFHTINVPLGILTNAWIVAIGANDGVFPILELCSRVGTTAAVARKGAPTSTVATWSIGGSIGWMATSGGVTPYSVLGLTGVGTDDGVAGATSSGGGSNERLRETNSLAWHSRDHDEVILGRLSRLEHLLKHLPLMGCVEGLDDAMIGKVAAEASEKTRVKAIDWPQLRVLPIVAGFEYLNLFWQMRPNLLWEIVSDAFGPRKESFPTFWQKPSVRNCFRRFRTELRL